MTSRSAQHSAQKPSQAVRESKGTTSPKESTHFTQSMLDATIATISWAPAASNESRFAVFRLRDARRLPAAETAAVFPIARRQRQQQQQQHHRQRHQGHGQGGHVRLIKVTRDVQVQKRGPIIFKKAISFSLTTIKSVTRPPPPPYGAKSAKNSVKKITLSVA